ncbi:MAG: acetyl-CoA C-acyltransferase [Elusimicrobiota bacterium]
MKELLILGAKRTPIGSFCGTLAGYTAPQLGAKAIAGALADSGLGPDRVSEVIMGIVVPAGVGQAPARQAALGAGIPVCAGATTVNKVCGSGMKAVMLAGQSLLLGESEVAVAGGMESMSRAPYYLDKARSGGYRLGHGQLIDAIVLDGLWDPYKDVHMGMCGELCAEKEGFTREMQDAYAAESYKRALAAQAAGAFASEIVPLPELSADEEPGRAKLDKMPKLKPAFKKDGTITPANASKINDGAAALVLSCSGSGGAFLARIAGWATHSQEPEWFSTAPARAIEAVLRKVGWKKEEVDLYEVNEAFSVVALVTMKQLGIPHEKLNVNGGAVALGHPIGASGARILVTLVHALAKRGARRGVAAICLGGGEAVAVAVER